MRVDGYEPQESTRELLGEVQDRAARFLESLPERRVTAARGADDLAQALGGALPRLGRPAPEILAQLDEIGSQGTVASVGPRYFGFVTGGALPASLAANWLATVWDQNAFSEVSSPIGAAVESVALQWVLELLRLPATSGAAFVTGATMANFSALAAARRSVLLAHGVDVDRTGLNGAPQITLVAGEQPMRPSSRRSECSVSVASRWSGCQPMAKAACAPMLSLTSPGPQSSVRRLAT